MRILASPAYSNRSANPYNWLLYSHMAKRGVEVCEFSRRRLVTGAHDVWHLHWPEAPLNDRSFRRAVVGLAQLLVMMEVARRRGMKIVWTIHNLSAHEEQHPRLASRFWKAFVRRLDGFISLSVAGEALALDKWPDLARLPGFIVPHGHYRGAYRDDVDVGAARERLGLPPDATVLAFVGQVRRYKGVPALCRAFSELSDDHARLLIAGNVKDGEVARDLRCAATSDPRIRLHLGFVPNEDIHLYLRAADLLVLPFVTVLNSASALLALSFDRPVLVPHTGPFAELQDRVGPEWVQMYENELTSDVLARVLPLAKLARSTGQPKLDTLDWPLLAEQTENVFKKVAGLKSTAQPRRTPPASTSAGPTVSVVIPVYNRPVAIRRAIESVLAQTQQDLEIIVVDDASTDGTAASVNSIGDSRVRLIRHDRKLGGSAARNTGIRAASGEYVAFLDSDDEWFPTKLERQLDVFAGASHRLGLVSTGAELRYADGHIRRVIPRLRGDLRRLLLMANVVGESSLGMVPRRVLDEVGNFDESLPARQDVDLWLRISERFLVDVVPDVLARIAKGDDGGRITADVAGRLQARELFCRKHEKKLVGEGILHLYLRQSGWKYYRELRDSRRARQCYIEAIAAKRTAPLTYVMLLLACLPASALTPVVWCKQRITRLLRFGRAKRLPSTASNHIGGGA